MSEFDICTKGVGVALTNKERTLFYLQQKDETYPLEKFRLKFCFFGGIVKEGEEELSALIRELKEELEEGAINLLPKKFMKVTTDNFLPVNRKNLAFEFVLFEGIMSDKDLKKISEMQIKEGKGGYLIPREKLESIKMNEDLINVLNKYLTLNG